MVIIAATTAAARRGGRPGRGGARRFEAVIFDWDGTAVPDRSADASAVRARIEQLCAAGVDVAVVSGTHVGNIDGQLAARPAGPGLLYLCLNRGSEVFAVDRDAPRLVWRRRASPAEEEALDRAAALTVERLGGRGLGCRIVSQRLNRRKIDIIPLPEWEDPPKAVIDRLLAAVTERLRGAGIGSLDEVVDVARAAALEAGLADPRVTSDVKHVEIGLTDKSDSARWLLEDLWARGVGPGLVLVAGDEFGPVGGVTGSDALMLVPEAESCTVVSVGVEPEGVPPGVEHRGGGPAAFLAILEEQLAARALGRVPDVDAVPGWSLTVPILSRDSERVEESLLCVSDGRYAVRGDREDNRDGTERGVLVAGVFGCGSDAMPRLLPGPAFTAVVGDDTDDRPEAPGERVLDLRTGLLARRPVAGGPGFRSLRFASVARPGLMLLRVEDEAGRRWPASPLSPPVLGGYDALASTLRFESGADGAVHRARAASGSGSIVAVASQREAVRAEGSALERIAVYSGSSRPQHPMARLHRRLEEGMTAGFDYLLREQRRSWAKRWADADIVIDGDPESQLAVRFALFHLLGAAAASGEAAVGARGATGQAYAGHVFWDADVFVLPALAAVLPGAAAAMLRYRLRRLPAARRAAAARGFAGARFPWESADSGEDVTPHSARTSRGELVPIRTGDHEEHINADVAWAARQYALWTGDGFLVGAGAPLVVETARYWASRIRLDRLGGHLYGVIGPDEYHEGVDDNAFTNMMARWHLRTAAALADRHGLAPPEESDAWRQLAGVLLDGYDPGSGRHEQFAGYYGLEPLLIANVAPAPVAADLLLGRERLAASQVIKQPDVLMAHHLIPEEMPPGSLQADLDFYGPRTAHGSSLSPAVQAAVLARAGRTDEAMTLFRLAARVDLADLTGTTAGGLHLATLGGLWQAVVFGFAGVRPVDGMIALDPHLPSEWKRLEIHLRHRGRRLVLRLRADEIEIEAERGMTLLLAGAPRQVSRRARFVGAGEWRESR